jgi:hypothetical protein
MDIILLADADFSIRSEYRDGGGLKELDGGAVRSAFAQSRGGQAKARGNDNRKNT